ncbi:unnamed protein product [Rangifer tarandus platyrhynchus]|uniref:Uncharacterized protein n=1 Tax=Rangifer tarandus platyrhynchus TaxID=3082113 RepID=A0AC59Z018_RANTA
MSAGCRSRKGRWVLSFLCACRRYRLLIPAFPSQKNYNPQQAQRCRAGPPLMKDWEQKKVASPNRPPPAALEEAKISGICGSPRTSPEPHDPGGSQPLTPRMESHSEEEDPPEAGGGLDWNGRSPQAQSPGGCSTEAMLAPGPEEAPPEAFKAQAACSLWQHIYKAQAALAALLGAQLG